MAYFYKNTKLVNFLCKLYIYLFRSERDDIVSAVSSLLGDQTHELARDTFTCRLSHGF